jgi:hypothetical protein
MPPVLRGPLLMSRCIIDRSMAYPHRLLGSYPNHLTKTFESRLRILLASQGKIIL